MILIIMAITIKIMMIDDTDHNDNYNDYNNVINEETIEDSYNVKYG